MGNFSLSELSFCRKGGAAKLLQNKGVSDASNHENPSLFTVA